MIMLTFGAGPSAQIRGSTVIGQIGDLYRYGIEKYTIEQASGFAIVWSKPVRGCRSMDLLLVYA